MGRHLRTRVPVLESNLVPLVSDHSDTTRNDAIFREKQRKHFNRRHGSRELPELCANDRVWVADLNKEGPVVRKASTPHSYIVRTNTGYLQRNRRALVSLQECDGNSGASGNSVQDAYHVLRDQQGRRTECPETVSSPLLSSATMGSGADEQPPETPATGSSDTARHSFGFPVAHT